ncbi:MAG: ribosomal protein S18-alanine N-acetyltransferase [Erysipelotrichaceae bacterium]|jgi:ribosomal-protein-alanine N-acetyltransferase|nr:ribosomal protein S18-alanine N-acetyltransferase [Erysipelotrichaceae bacterium]
MAHKDYEIINAEFSDIVKIYEIIKKYDSSWNLEAVENEICNNPFSISKCIFMNNVMCGFIIYWITFDSATIVQIAVDENYRKLGLGSALMSTAIEDLKSRRVKNVTLEVRVNNLSAISLYEKFGFKNTLIKKNYYQDGTDAIYMIKEVR